MSLMPLHFTLCKDVTHVHVYVYWLLMAWRVYERMHLANPTTYCLRANTSSECNYYEHWHWSYTSNTSHITHHTSHPRLYRNVHHIHIAYCIREHYILHPLPPLFMRHHTNLFLFIAIYHLFEDVIFKCDGISKSRHRSVGRSVVVSSRLVVVHLMYSTASI